MNPFSGFMQAVTGSVPGFGEKTGNIGKGPPGLPIDDDTMMPTDENTRSFLAWVLNFMDNSACAGADGERVFNFQPSGLDPDLPAPDQLQALMADAEDQFSQDQQGPRSLKGGSFDNWTVPLPQGIIDVIIAHHARSHADDTPTHDALPDISEMMAGKDHTPVVGQAHAAGEDPLFQTVVSSVPTQAVKGDARLSKAVAPAVGQTANVAVNGSPFQAAVSDVPAQSGKGDAPHIKEDTPAFGQPKPAASGIPTQAAKADDGQIKTSTPEWVIKQNRSEEGVEKAGAHVLFKPAAPAGDDGQAHTSRLIQERWPAGPGIAGKVNDPATSHLQPAAVQAMDRESMVTGLAAQGSAQQEGDSAGSRGKDPHQPARRVEPRDVNEAEWQKGLSSDAVKSTGSEQTKPQPTFPDTAKGMVGDPPTHMAVKSAAGQAAALTRTEDAAVKTFQATVMDQIVDKAAMRSIHGRSEIQIRLKPEFLGNVQMNIAADKEQLVVRIITDRPVVKEIIETHLHHLKTELQNQGLTIDKFEVMVNPDGNQQHSREQFAGMFRHHFSQNGRRQQQEQDPETLNRNGGNTPDDGRPTRDGVNYFA